MADFVSKGNESDTKKVRFRIWIMGIALIAAFFISMCIGRYAITPPDIVRIIAEHLTGATSTYDVMTTNVVMQVRLPRILLSIIIGAGLASSGASYQCLFGNPLVSPDILGVSAGAGFGASLAILLSAGNISIQLVALVCGLGAVGIVLVISRVRKKTELFMLVLSGVIVGAFFEALISFIKYIADPQNKLPAITIWLMGSLASASYRKLLIAAVTILPCILILIVLRWKMNLLSLSEEEATSLGVNVNRLRVVIILTATLMTAVSVSLCGIIGWIGLVIPHIGRFFIGHDHRGLIPSCVLLGGIYMLFIDGIARTLTAAELPLSILTAIIGAPFFAVMLHRTMGGGKGS